MRTAWGNVPRWLHAALFIGSLPILIPSLFFSFIMAKRWGRIDFALIFLDALLLVFLCVMSPLFLPVAVLSAACLSALAILRAPKLGQGIFLGYSNAVALSVIFTGPLLLIGLFKIVPLGRWDAALRRGSVQSVPLRQIEKVGQTGNVRLTEATLDWDGRLYHTASNRFYRFDPTQPVEVLDASEILEREGELLGARVKLRDSSVHAARATRTGVQYSYAPIPKDHSGLLTDATSRVYSPASTGRPGKVWLASDNGTFGTGTLAWTLTEDSFGRQNRLFPVPMYGAFLAVIAGLEPSPVADVWVPVKGHTTSVWLIVAPDAARPEQIQGMYEPHSLEKERDSLRDSGLFNPPPSEVYALDARPAAGQAVTPEAPPIAWGTALAFLIPGIVGIGGALYLALNE